MVQWIGQKLNEILGPVWAPYAGYVLTGLAFIMLVVIMAVISIYLERKIAAFMQMRLGPMRVGKWGTLQAFADVFKLMLKESLTPAQADKQLFNIAPYLVLTVSFLAFAPIAFSPSLQLWNMNIGVLYITSISSVGVIGILMAGWASNNKYSLLGAMRSGAQIVSYELSAGIAILTIVMMSGSLSVSGIIQSQADGWWLFKGHIPALIAFVIFAIASTAELNRAPFDLAEAEQELTAGFHTEYSGMQFAMFFLAEYTNMFIVSMLGTTLFLGGWMPLHIGNWEFFNQLMDKIPPFLWFFGKVFISLFMIIWFRWTFPRLRIDQLLKLEWKYLLPIGMVNLVIAAIVTWLGWIF
ncbi:MAG: NADH-quinone oxidoreductase subunit NuoH [Bacteroidales bacterium]